MRHPLSITLQQGVLAGLLVGVLALSFSVSSSADNTMLLRTVPLEVSGYPEAEDLDNRVKDAESTMQLINESKPLLVHMEAIRRAYTQYGANLDEKTKLLNALKSRYMSDQENAANFFDYGYAQLVMDANKNGLFFLRKANDKLGSPFTSLAYGLAQVDIDILSEGASPQDLTTRKMDAMYKLKDALAYNKEDRLPGVWSSYIRILDGLKDYTAYDSFRAEDVTTMYVPYGVTSISQETGNQYLALVSPAEETSDTSTPEESSAEPALDVEPTCIFSEAVPDLSTLAFSKSIDLDNDGTAESINFFSAKSGEPYEVKVLNQANKVIGAFTSYKAPYITEDLEGDKRFELVIRQYEKDPYHPLYVYRWNGSCYAQDKRVSSYFK